MAGSFTLLHRFQYGLWAHTSRRRVFSESASPSQTFHADLAQSMQTLLHFKQATHANENSSLSWFCSALDLVISTHISLKQAIATAEEGQTILCVDQYTEESGKLLDVCLQFKKSLSGIHTYLNAAKNALKRCKSVRGEGDLLRAKHALLSAQTCLNELAQEKQTQVDFVRRSERQTSKKRLSACGSIMRRVKEDDLSSEQALPSFILGLDRNPSAAGLPAALYAAEMVTLLVFQMLSRALATNSPQARAGQGMSLRLARLCMSSQQPAWERILLCIQALHNTEQAQSSWKGKTLPGEVCAIEAFLKQISGLMSQITELEQPPASLKRRSRIATITREDLHYLVRETEKQMQTLECCVDRLQEQLESLFKSLLETRLALLPSPSAR